MVKTNSTKLVDKILIIIPTYNEVENIKGIIEKVHALNVPNLSILVVDDNSPDGTADVVKDMANTDQRILLKQRSGKLGLGTAYVEGFKYAIEHDYDFIFEMDADHSHKPKEIPQMLKK